ncbi:Uncharacterised protein (plasmid) [Tsukamurella tyrosinosolvens]|uniref:Helix-turn-helix n=1 Tax=Tsukamurella tyrosinosolvens TaxID=57704 RepID=A0A1H4UJX5_TSUTY|nr:helix-turn-helix transcriptional regulator [Tsukamurella tyrosinosolvens]KXO99049.1 hypothetical protein AXK58_24145 [Tsukamurella tyrosinosolvens]SEC69079.1 Helix-turn-helix [Tsukamurella tyrosinosolvens]VEH94304.1 Uncharacterised protein [Tsukamurella tyrosinosolvens]
MNAAQSNLSEVIDQLRPADTSRAELAAQLGVTPQTLSRWTDRMPPPETVRKLAGVLGAPYSVVLAAALRSGGYVETRADLLEGQQVTVVSRDPDCAELEDANEGVTAAAFVDEAKAQEWARVRGALDLIDGGYGTREVSVSEVTVGQVRSPEFAEVFTARWDHASDVITVGEPYVLPEVPTRLAQSEDGAGAVDVNELRSNGKVFEGRVDALDPAAARVALGAAIARLRSEGKLLGPAEATGLQFTDRIAHVGSRVMYDATRDSGEPAPELTPALQALLKKLEKAPYELGGHDGQDLSGLARRQISYVWGGGGAVDATSGPDPIVSRTLDDERR